MSTVVVRKKDGSLVEFTHEKKLSFMISRRDVNVVSIWVQGEPGGNVAEVEGVEAWVKGVLAQAVPDKFTGYYVKNGVFYTSAYTGYVVDRTARFRIYPESAVSGWDDNMRSHQDWVKLGFRPVEKIDLRQ